MGLYGCLGGPLWRPCFYRAVIVFNFVLRINSRNTVQCDVVFTLLMSTFIVSCVLPACVPLLMVLMVYRYTSLELLAAKPAAPPISRSVRKTLFSLGIWCPNIDSLGTGATSHDTSVSLGALDRHTQQPRRTPQANDPTSSGLNSTGNSNLGPSAATLDAEPSQDFQALGPALRILQLNVEGLSAAKWNIISVIAKDHKVDAV